MKTIDKLKIIETLPFENVEVSAVSNQSIKVIYPCGCSFVQHGSCGKPKCSPQSINYEERQVDRMFFIELCKIHQK